MKFEIIKGDLIQKALSGEFDVIAHGCNCFCVQGAGIALAMNEAFSTLKFMSEHINFRGSVFKLGNIEYEGKYRNSPRASHPHPRMEGYDYFVVNAYIQYQPGRNLDYEALTLCMRKLNYEFKGKHIGLPWIGCGIAGGNKTRVEQILRTELKDCNVTICEL